MCDDDEQMRVYEHSSASFHHALTISEDGTSAQGGHEEVQHGLQQEHATDQTKTSVNENDVEALIEKRIDEVCMHVITGR
jgi:hypothetical protein